MSSSRIINPRRPESPPNGWGRNSINWITELITGTMQIGTHLDGLNHLQLGDRFYNGFQTREIVEEGERISDEDANTGPLTALRSNAVIIS